MASQMITPCKHIGTMHDRHDGGPGVHDVHQDIPGEFLEDMMLDYYKAHVFVSPAKRLDIESATRGQSVANEMASSMWMAE